jgi:hypothetical protein
LFDVASCQFPQWAQNYPQSLGATRPDLNPLLPGHLQPARASHQGDDERYD